MYPILGKISNSSSSEVFLIGAYHGYEKPESIDEFLNPFLEEFEKLKKDGLYLNEVLYSVDINSVICDSPARSLVTCTKSHSGYFGCPRCTDKGVHINHRLCFPNTNSELRNDESFSSRRNAEYYTGDSPFEKIGLDMITQFPMDPMHFRDIGMGKIFIRLLLNGTSKIKKLKAEDVDEFSKSLISLGSMIPCEFARKPRGIDEIKRWKATECRLFLHYLGPINLNKILADEYVLHFNTLHAGLTILSNKEEYKTNNDLADTLLKRFVETFKILYGEDYLIYTIHCMQHLAKETLLQNGPLDNYTAYPFVNYMQTLKRMIRRPSNVLPQLFRRLVENSQNKKSKFVERKKSDSYPQLSKPTKTNVPSGFSTAYEELRLQTFKLTNKRPDNCCYLKNGNIILINCIVEKDNKPVIIGKIFKTLKSFPNYPGKSEDLDLYVAEELGETIICPENEIKKKAVLLSIKEKFFIIPLLHTS